MSLFDVFRVNEIKAELARSAKECESLRKALEETDRMEHHQLKQAIEDLRAQKEKALQEAQAAQAEFAKRRLGLDQQLAELAKQIDLRKKEIT